MVAGVSLPLTRTEIDAPSRASDAFTHAKPIAAFCIDENRELVTRPEGLPFNTIAAPSFGKPLAFKMKPTSFSRV